MAKAPNTNNSPFPYADGAAPLLLESFSQLAGDLIRLRRALYGPDDAKFLILACARRSRSAKINVRTVERVWQAMDEAYLAAAKAAREAGLDDDTSDAVGHAVAARFIEDQLVGAAFRRAIDEEIMRHTMP